LQLAPRHLALVNQRTGHPGQNVSGLRAIKNSGSEHRGQGSGFIDGLLGAWDKRMALCEWAAGYSIALWYDRAIPRERPDIPGYRERWIKTVQCSAKSAAVSTAKHLPRFFYDLADE